MGSPGLWRFLAACPKQRQSLWDRAETPGWGTDPLVDRLQVGQEAAGVGETFPKAVGGYSIVGGLFHGEGLLNQCRPQTRGRYW